MPPNPATAERLLQVYRAAQAAPRGDKSALYQAACTELNMSLSTLHRHMATLAHKPARKQRADAGAVVLPRTEALIISALLMESHRKNAKRLLSIGQAVEILRANGEIVAARLDAETGELVPLSDSAIARALRTYGLHPGQLLRPAPATELQSLHPNHVWQIDASLCVLYYLNARTPAEAGLQIMQREVFYKNKPGNLKRIENDRVWSYEVTDHYSGALFVHYVLGAESGANLAESFIAAIQKREGDPFHGVPLTLMMDMGSANTGGLFTNLARRLQVKTVAHAPGNARATGQVEKARDIIERSFESSLKLRPVHSLDELNANAQRWATWYNGHRVHSRHGKTRYDMWMTIRAEQLRVAPPPELCRELLTHSPEQRKVSQTLTVQFKGREFDVRGIDGLLVGQKVEITYNPWHTEGSAMLIGKDADGNETLTPVPLVERNEAGFREDAPVIGEQYARAIDTPAQTHAKEIERLVMGADTDAAAEAARKAKALPFGGRIDPFKPIEQAPAKQWLPRRGEQLQPAVAMSVRAARVLTLFEAARSLAERLGAPLTPAQLALVRQLHPEGVPEDQLDALQQRLTVRAGLRVVGGGAANE